MPDNVEGMLLREAGGVIDGFGTVGNDTIIGIPLPIGCMAGLAAMR
jgi:hypothetical protein